MPARLYYYVVDCGEAWEVQLASRRRSPVARRATQAEATAAAIAAAEAEWLSNSVLTGVRVPDLLNQWKDEMVFGEDADQTPPRETPVASRRRDNR